MGMPRWSLSQHGEVEAIFEHSLSFFIKSKVIVDVGAAESEISNSIDFIRFFGFRGLLIEANPELVKILQNQTSGSNVRVVEAAISDEEVESKLWLGVNDHISSLISSATESWGDLSGYIPVVTKRLGPILEANSIPKKFGILSIDIEGMDLRVLKDLLATTKYRPQLILLEYGEGADQVNSQTSDLEFLFKHYILIGNYGPNLLMRTKGGFVKSQIRKLRDSLRLSI
jgi:FkbM family methyltransferase